MTTPAGDTADYVDFVYPPCIAVPFGPGATTLAPYTRGCVLVGWTVVDVAGAAGTVYTLRDGTDATGQIVDVVTLSATFSGRGQHDDGGLLITRGLCIVGPTATYSGVAWVRP